MQKFKVNAKNIFLEHEFSTYIFCSWHFWMNSAGIENIVVTNFKPLRVANYTVKDEQMSIGRLQKSKGIIHLTWPKILQLQRVFHFIFRDKTRGY